MTELRPAISEALRKAGRKITAAELYQLLGTSETKKKVNATLFRMKGDGSVKASPGDSPHKTLYAVGALHVEHAPKLNGHERPQTETKAPKRETKRRKTETRPPPEPKTESPAPAAGNVGNFVPAMTADKRMVIVGGSEPLIFSADQTQTIADLIFENFEANV